MDKVYACLTGKWVCLNDDPECVMGKDFVSPSQWYKEEPNVYSPIKREKENTYYDLDHVNIFYRNKTYRINPIFIQIVSE